MNDETTPRDIAEQTTKNINLAGRFLQEVLADPDVLDKIPDDATVVLIPPDDSDLARGNLALATKYAEAGKEVVLYRVGVPEPDVPAWREHEMTTIAMRKIAVHWPPALAPESGDLIIVYDRDRDVLFVDFFGLRRLGMGFPIGGSGMAARVDVETEEIVGYLLAGFLTATVLRAPHLTSLLRIAEFRELTFEELGGLEPPAVTRPGPETEQEAAKALANEFSQLIA
jgi:Family of unknown function (DUF5647)